MKKVFINISLLLLVFYSGCSEKFDLTQFQTSKNVNVGGDTLYIQINPEWGGFNNPQDVYIGREPFIYVCDTDNDRIVMMNLNGQILGTKSIKHPVAIAQDYKLNLIVCAQFDTIAGGVNKTFSAVYKINLVDVNHKIENAAVTRLLPREVDFNYPQREYTGVTVFYNNIFYVARKGPSNGSLFDPDNSILIYYPKSFFNAGSGDSLIGRVANIDPLSSGLISANSLSSIATINKKNYDFIATLTGNNVFKTQWFHYQISAIEEKYVSQFSPRDGVDFISPNRFDQPEGCCVDENGNIFVADAVKDSIFKFNVYGDELESFGGPKVFKSPYGVAVFNKILYVADSKNNRILRFILSTNM